MNDYYNNGYNIYKNILDLNKINIIYDKIIHILDNIKGKKEFTIDYPQFLEEKINYIYNKLYDIYIDDSDYYFELVKSNGIFSNILEIKEIFLSDKILNIINSLNINNISVPITAQVHLFCDFATNVNYRNGKLGLDTHQDWPQMRGSLNNMVVWIALNNINNNNCPLEIIDKSHLNGYLDGKNDIKLDNRKILTDYKEDEFIKINLNTGDAICFSSWLIHKTGVFKNNEKFRFAISLRYNDLDDPYFIENKFKIAYNTIMNRDDNQTRIPRQEEILNYFNL